MTIRFGVVGTAYWASSIHSVGIAATPGARLAGIWGRDDAKAQALADARGVARFAHFDAMLDDVDAVSFAVPPAVQEVLAPRAIAAGKHVLLEKPIATTHRQAQTIADAVDRAGLASMVFFTRLFVPEIADTLARHAPARWSSATIDVRSSALAPGSPYAQSVWRRADGAALWDIGPHVLSVLIAMLGPVVDVARLPSDDRQLIRFTARHARGGVATVSLTLHASVETMGQRYRFDGDDGALVLPEPSFDRAAIFTRAVGALVDAITTGTRGHPCDVVLGAEVVRILEALDRPL